MSGIKHKKGLTLIEVLLAAALLSLSLVTLLTAISRCMWVFKTSASYHEAMWALSMGDAENPLIKTMIPKDFEPSDYEVSPEKYGNITYERTVEDPYKDDEDSKTRLLVIKTKLAWAGQKRDKKEVITRYLLYREK